MLLWEGALTSSNSVHPHSIFVNRPAMMKIAWVRIIITLENISLLTNYSNDFMAERRRKMSCK